MLKNGMNKKQKKYGEMCKYLVIIYMLLLENRDKEDVIKQLRKEVEKIDEMEREIEDLKIEKQKNRDLQGDVFIPFSRRLLNKKTEENKKLKDLLKDCREIIDWYKQDCGYQDKPTDSVLARIDEVLK